MWGWIDQSTGTLPVAWQMGELVVKAAAGIFVILFVIRPVVSRIIHNIPKISRQHNGDEPGFVSRHYNHLYPLTLLVCWTISMGGYFLLLFLNQALWLMNHAYLFSSIMSYMAVHQVRDEAPHPVRDEIPCRERLRVRLWLASPVILFIAATTAIAVIGDLSGQGGGVIVAWLGDGIVIWLPALFGLHLYTLWKTDLLRRCTA